MSKKMNIVRYFFIILAISSIVMVKNYSSFMCIIGALIIIECVRVALKKQNENVIYTCINGNLYIADCYAYEVIKRKSGKHNNIITYYIKITDNIGGYLKKEFEVDYESVNTNSDIQARLYVIEYEERYKLDVCTERMINLGKI